MGCSDAYLPIQSSDPRIPELEAPPEPIPAPPAPWELVEAHAQAPEVLAAAKAYKDLACQESSLTKELREVEVQRVKLGMKSQDLQGKINALGRPVQEARAHLLNMILKSSL